MHALGGTAEIPRVDKHVALFLQRVIARGHRAELVRHIARDALRRLRRRHTDESGSNRRCHKDITRYFFVARFKRSYPGAAVLRSLRKHTPILRKVLPGETAFSMAYTVGRNLFRRGYARNFLSWQADTRTPRQGGEGEV